MAAPLAQAPGKMVIIMHVCYDSALGSDRGRQRRQGAPPSRALGVAAEAERIATACTLTLP